VQISIHAIENEGQSRQRNHRRKTIIPTDHFKPDFRARREQRCVPPGSFDVAVRSGAGEWPGYRAVKLMDEVGTLMISPKLLPPRRRRLTIDGALALPLIPDRRWAAWFKLAGVPQAKPRFAAARFPTYELEARAAVQGIGAALLSPVLFADLCERGDLVAPFKMRLLGPASYWLLWKNEGPEPHFVAWLRSQFAADNAAPLT